jgi:hypothetical protein
MRNRVERLFRYLKERTIVFHHKLSARNHIQGITNLKPIHNILSCSEGREVSKNAYLDTMEVRSRRNGGKNIEPAFRQHHRNPYIP